MITAPTDLFELACLIHASFRRHGVQAVLTGGACVSIYTENRYLSHDLDFVLEILSQVPLAEAAMLSLGFRREGRHFRHPGTPFVVEFLPPPVSVGDEPVRDILEIRRKRRRLRLLSPTDCVKDRLAAFYHWNDRPSLRQALLVCRDQVVDMEEIRRWSRHEGMSEKFAFFRRSLRESK
jgi:hypothetical protein